MICLPVSHYEVNELYHAWNFPLLTQETHMVFGLTKYIWGKKKKKPWISLSALWIYVWPNNNKEQEEEEEERTRRKEKNLSGFQEITTAAAAFTIVVIIIIIIEALLHLFCAALWVLFLFYPY